MTVSIPKAEVKEYIKMKVMVELNSAKERIRILETKYHRNFSEFETWMGKSEENFDVWSDYLAWKAYNRLFLTLTQELTEVDHAQDVQLT